MLLLNYRPTWFSVYIATTAGEMKPVKVAMEYEIATTIPA